MAGGFLSRWSRRKAGEQVELELRPADMARQADVTEPAELNIPVKDQDLPAPATLEDVEKIDRFAPDFSAFMKPGVDPAVQQAAMKKMFSDPHFNVMDGLDIYIDDYSKPDPIPLEMLKRLVQSDMLNIFRKGDGQVEENEARVASIPSEHKEGEQALPLNARAALTSTSSSADPGEVSPDGIPSDKKNS